MRRRILKIIFEVLTSEVGTPLEEGVLLNFENNKEYERKRNTRDFRTQEKMCYTTVYNAQFTYLYKHRTEH